MPYHDDDVLVCLIFLCHCSVKRIAGIGTEGRRGEGGGEKEEGEVRRRGEMKQVMTRGSGVEEVYTYNRRVMRERKGTN